MVVIPKTVTASRITENIKATEIKLDAEDMKRLRELESKNFRCLKVCKCWFEWSMLRDSPLSWGIQCHMLELVKVLAKEVLTK